jgi:hypothetical protein
MAKKRAQVIRDTEYQKVERTKYPGIVKVTDKDTKYVSFVFKPICRYCHEKVDFCACEDDLEAARDKVHRWGHWNCACMEAFEKALESVRTGTPLKDGDCYYVTEFLKGRQDEMGEYSWWEWLIFPDIWQDFVDATGEHFSDDGEGTCECPLGAN